MPNVNQVVNIDGTSADQRQAIPQAQCGQNIRVELTVNPAVRGVTVEFEIVPGAQNITLLQAQALGRDGDDLAETVSKPGVTDDNGTAGADFRLSTFGGDEFTFNAYVLGADAARGPAVALGNNYIIRKRLYYQMTTFDGWIGRNGPIAAVAAPNMGNVVAEFAARSHNIDLVAQAPTANPITRRATVVATNENRDMLNAAARQGYDATRDPVAMKIVMVPQLNDPREAAVTYTDLRPSTVVAQNVAQDLWVDESKPLLGDWLVSAQWCWASGDLLWKDLLALNGAGVAATGARQIQITIPAMPERLLSSDRNVSVKITYRYKSTNSAGALSLENAVWIPVDEMGTHGAAATQAIAAGHMDLLLIHEIAHTMGMVVSGHPNRYTGRGHVGPHCAHGLTPLERQGGRYAGLATGDCVMFGGPSAAQQAQFCADCDIWLRPRVVKPGPPTAW